MATRYKKSEDVRNALLDTAEALFAERGLFGVSIRDITDAAGLRNASINYHFESKENLFLAVIDRRIEPLCPCGKIFGSSSSNFPPMRSIPDSLLFPISAKYYALRSL